MKCPKCRFEQEPAVCCAVCGVDMEKYQRVLETQDDRHGVPAGVYYDAGVRTELVMSPVPYRKNRCGRATVLELALALGVVLVLAMSMGDVQIAARGLASLSWPRAQGRIVISGIEAESFGKNLYVYRPYIVYAYQVNGAVYRSRTVAVARLAGGKTSRALADRFGQGAEAPVYYDPKNPSASVLVPGVPQEIKARVLWWGLAAMTGFCCLVLRWILRRIRVRARFEA